MSNVPRLVYDRLRASGLSPHAAAALVANVGMESSFNTGSRNPGDGRDGSDSIGLAQWNSSRAQTLKNLAAQQGKDWRDPTVQADFIVQELNSTERRAKAALEAAPDVRSAGAAAIGYFRPAGFTWDNPMGGHNADKRVAETMRFANEFGGLPAQTGVAATGAPMQMPDLTTTSKAPEATPSPSPEAAPTQPSFDLAKAIASFAEAFKPAQNTPQPAQKPQMPPLRQAQPRVQLIERAVQPTKKADLATIFAL